jgi:hypothetical protein
MDEILAEDDRLHKFWHDNKEKREDTDENIQYWDRVVEWTAVDRRRSTFSEQKESQIDFPVSALWQQFYAERGLMPYPPPTRETHVPPPERSNAEYGLGSIDEDRLAQLERRLTEQGRELRALRDGQPRRDTPPRPERQQSTGVQRLRKDN